MDSRKKLALPDTFSRNTQALLLTSKTTVGIPQNLKFFLAKDETSPRLHCKYAVKTDIDQSQINKLHHFALYLDCQKNHYELDLLGKSTFKTLTNLSWVKNKSQQSQSNKYKKKQIYSL